MQAITKTQAELLAKIEAFRDAQTKRINDEIAKGTFSHVENPRASQWVSIAALARAFSFRLATVRALVKAGELLKRSTDGFGPEVLVTRSASADEIAKGEESILQQERDAEDRFRALCGD